MARKVKWTEVAWNDLEKIVDYIAKDSPDYGEEFVYKVRDVARSLGYLSNRGHVVSEFGDPSIREVFIRRLRLINQVRGKTIYIIGLIPDHVLYWHYRNEGIAKKE